MKEEDGKKQKTAEVTRHDLAEWSELGERERERARERQTEREREREKERELVFGAKRNL